MSKESRETYHILKEGKDFQHKIYLRATDPSIRNLHPNDYLIALDELKKIAGVGKKE